MRSFSLFALALLVAEAKKKTTTSTTAAVQPAGGEDQTFAPSEVFQLLEDVYGEVTEPTDLLPWDERVLLNSSEPISSEGEEDEEEDEEDAEYADVRRPDHCVFPIDVVFVQDLTTTFGNHLQVLRDSQIPAMFEALQKTHPDSRFGAISFRDKPIFPFGVSGDYCWRFEAPLNPQFNALGTAYEKFTTSGGGDPWENQFGALMAAAQSSGISWGPRKSTKLIVLVTDSSPHHALDGLNIDNLSPAKDVINDSNPDNQCTTEYYPSPEQVRKALRARDAYAAFVVFDPTHVTDVPAEQWTWFNNFIGQPREFVNPLAHDGSDFWTKLSHTISRIEQAECHRPKPTHRPDPDCPCDDHHHGCQCPEVQIKLLKRPKMMHIVVQNE